MAFFLDEFQHLKIQLDDIKSATDNFNENNLIGKGGFGKVYKGEISHSKGRSMVAFKRLDSGSLQGNSEFWREIMMLSGYTHENLVSLLGYCDEGEEKVLVYEHLSRGSLDHYICDPALTWMHRLKICLGAARGLNYLHDPVGTQQRVLHRDIKSSNILLDENWNAKVSDLGLSKIGPANQQHTFLVSNVVGTPGYVDPLYLEMGVLTKESDVYSFGVVLFEVLCGRLCYTYSNDRYTTLVRMWKKSYKEKKLDEIISQDHLQQMDANSLETFSDIAYQCLQKTHEKRPLMVDVVGKLEIALQSQEVYEVVESLEYDAIIKSATPPLIFRSKAELQALLSKGILINGGETWFSLNENGEHCEMISSSEFIPQWNLPREFAAKSRFREYKLVLEYFGEFKAYVRPRFLSPGIAYTINLVFKFKSPIRNPNPNEPLYLGLKYKLEGETKYSIAYHAHRREDGWMTVELYQFTSHKTDFDLQILFAGTTKFFDSKLVVEGIEFRPSERVAPEVEKLDIQLISDLDTDWETKLPEDYEEIIKWSQYNIKWTTKRELYFLFCKGFPINNGWFFLANGKKCLFLPAKNMISPKNRWRFKYFPDSRYGDVAIGCRSRSLRTSGEIKFELLSPRTTYACYLVYKITKDHSNIEEPVQVRHLNETSRFIHLDGPQSRVIRPNFDQNTHNPSQIPQIKGLRQLRSDGWMEVQIWEFETSDDALETFKMDFVLDRKPFKGYFYVYSVQGIEVRPESLSSL